MGSVPHRTRRRLGALALVLVALSATAESRAAQPAHDGAPADSAVARAAKQFVEGQKAFAAGDYRRAATLFEGAYKDKPHHSALWNAARSWERAGEEILAANLYARFLAEAPANAPDRDQANASLRELATRMGRIELHGAEGTTNFRLDGQPVDASEVYVAVGEHLAEADANKGPIRKTVRVAAGQVVSVTLEPPPPQRVVVAAPPPPARPRGLSPAFFIVGASLTAVGAGLSVASGLDTVAKRDAFVTGPTQERLDAGFSSQSRTNVAIGVSAGLAVVTAVVGVFFTGWNGSASTARASAPVGWVF